MDQIKAAFVEALRQALYELEEEDEDVILIIPDVEAAVAVARKAVKEKALAE